MHAALEDCFIASLSVVWMLMQVLCQFTLLNPERPTWGAVWGWGLPTESNAKEVSRYAKFSIITDIAHCDLKL